MFAVRVFTREESPLTQAQLDCAVASATGESLDTIRGLGFSTLADDRAGLESEDLCLVLDCPFCGRPIPYPGLVRDGSPALAECDRCDIYFETEPGDVYAADSRSDLRHA
jgi:hypothetical protein